MWTKVRFGLTDPARVEDLTTELWLQGAVGCEVRDPETFSELDGSSFGGLPDGTLEVIAYFAAADDPPRLSEWVDTLSYVRLLGAQPFDDAAWSVSWRQFFLPTRISDRIVVRPSWDERLADDAPAEVVVIDPGMAFGTGTHETTRLCVQAVDEHLLAHPRSSVLDVGCGSGILSIVAAKLGARVVCGVDDDPEAVRVARENWALNGLSGESDAPFATTPLAEVTSCYGLVVANILSGVLLQLRDALIGATAPGGRLVLSGLLDTEVDRFVERFVRPPVALDRRAVSEGWAALWCTVR